jgi:hypothetical protein
MPAYYVVWIAEFVFAETVVVVVVVEQRFSDEVLMEVHFSGLYG